VRWPVCQISPNITFLISTQSYLNLYMESPLNTTSANSPLKLLENDYLDILLSDELQSYFVEENSVPPLITISDDDSNSISQSPPTPPLDPKLLRKLRNRESAAVSYQKRKKLMSTLVAQNKLLLQKVSDQEREINSLREALAVERQQQQMKEGGRALHVNSDTILPTSVGGSGTGGFGSHMNNNNNITNINNKKRKTKQDLSLSTTNLVVMSAVAISCFVCVLDPAGGPHNRRLQQSENDTAPPSIFNLKDSSEFATVVSFLVLLFSIVWGLFTVVSENIKSQRAKL